MNYISFRLAFNICVGSC